MTRNGRVGYERLSKDKSLRGISVTIQRQEIDDFADDTGESIDDHFCDNNISASEFSTKARNAYEQLLQRIQQKLVTEIVITEVPRLARKTEEAIELITLAKVTPFRYVKTTDGMVYDLGTPRGRKSFRDAVSDAEFESDQTSSRQHRRKNNQAEKGKFHGGQRRFGYEGPIYNEYGILMNPGRVGVAFVPSEVAALEEAARRIIAGERELDVVRDFNKRGIPANKGGRWRTGNLMTMLTQKSRYAFDEFPGPGTRVHKPKAKEYRAVWPAIFPKETLEGLRAAQLRVRSQRNGKSGRRGKSRTYALTGLVYCECGALVYGNGKTQASGNYQRRYRCRKTDNFGEVVGCGRVFRAAHSLEHFVRDALVFRFDSPQVAKLLSPGEDQEKVGEIVDRLTNLRLRREQIVREHALGDLNKDDFVMSRATLDDAIQEAQDQLSKIQTAAAVNLLPVDGKIGKSWDDGSMSHKFALAKLVIKKIIIRKVTDRTAKWNGYSFNPNDVEIIWSD